MIETDRLRIVTNCSVENGKLVFPKQSAQIDIDILNVARS